MSRYDFSPLFQSTIGFDRLNRLVETALSPDNGAGNYPPHDIEKAGEDSYRIVMAVAGLREEDLAITAERSVLTVKAKARPVADGVRYLHRGIARRGFERRFHLAEHVKVSDASLDAGLLIVELAREVPEALKPRRINITRGAGRLEATA